MLGAIGAAWLVLVFVFLFLVVVVMRALSKQATTLRTNMEAVI